MTRRSALLPDDVADFEAASSDRPDGVLAPPYDPEAESLNTGTRRRGVAPKRHGINHTRELRSALERSDPFLLKVMRKQMKRMRKVAMKNGINFEEVNLWEL